MSGRVSARSKYHLRDAPADVEDSRWQCDSCPAPVENLPGARYCMICRMYWTDAQNGLFDRWDTEPGSMR